MSAPRVLVVGYRKGLIDVLRRRGIAHVLWHDRPVRRKGLTCVVAPFETTPSKMREAAQAFADQGPFTHVIAGVERSVVTASYARRELGARKSTHSTVIRCHDKLVMKETLTERGVPMTPFRRAKHEEGGKGLVAELGKPVVVKDRRSSGGRGVEFLDDPAAVDAAATRMRIAERFVQAEEVSVESFIHEGEVVFANITEYVVKRHVNVVPARLDDDTTRAVLALNRLVIDALRIRWGMTHLELYLAEDGPLFGEIALRPPGGYIMELLELAYGFSAWEAFVDVELGNAPAVKAKPRAHAAAWVIHPGPGRVVAVMGKDELKLDDAVRQLTVSVDVGESLTVREGAGEEAGHVLFSAKSREALLDALGRAKQTLRIEMAPADEAS